MLMSVATYWPSVALARESDSQKAVEQSQHAAQVLRDVMGADDSAIPQNLLDRAECVAVFPDVVKAAFVFGGSGGHGQVVCKTPTGWSNPVFLDLGGVSWGAQIGVESADYVLLFMTSDGVHKLLDDKVKLGASASIAAGPVGRHASAATNLRLDSQILSYSRTKGVFAGVSLDGATVQSDDDLMKAVYTTSINAQHVLSTHGTVMPGVDAVRTAIAAYENGAAGEQ
jgi:lipid-binding SYLF domain-containing protein